MNWEELEKALEIRYIRLRFQVIIEEDGELPYYKGFSLRGGIGEMLLRQNCVYQRDKCQECGFQKECVVRRIMYAKPEISIPFMNNGESLGYNLECTDHRTAFQKEDMLEFHLVLFGKCIPYFWIYLQAVHALGREGIGKEKVRFRIHRILNIQRKPIVIENQIDKSAYEWETVNAYVERRMHYLKRDTGSYEIRFLTPATLKYQGEFLSEFHWDAFLKAALRRIYMMDCFEGISIGQMVCEGEEPVLRAQRIHVSSIFRYSSTQEKRIPLKGLGGWAEMEAVPDLLLACIVAGEVLHVGKNSSFGFGMYRISAVD